MSKGRLSSQMSPDERSKIQELRKKISDATSRSNYGVGSPRMTQSPRLLDHPQ